VKPGSLYGKFTWKIDTFSEISKRELRSNMFDVGGQVVRLARSRWHAGVRRSCGVAPELAAPRVLRACVPPSASWASCPDTYWCHVCGLPPSALALLWTVAVAGTSWVYPHGCDVCNHLSLFLCVADYDKLLPGWSHFAQFTIAIVNKDPKKSKYSGACAPPPGATRKHSPVLPLGAAALRPLSPLRPSQAVPSQGRARVTRPSTPCLVCVCVAQTRCTASVRRSTTGGGRSSWSSPSSWTASRSMTRWSSRRRCRSSGASARAAQRPTPAAMLGHGLSLPMGWPIIAHGLAYHCPWAGLSLPMGWPIIAHGLYWGTAGHTSNWRHLRGSSWGQVCASILRPTPPSSQGTRHPRAPLQAQYPVGLSLLP